MNKKKFIKKSKWIYKNSVDKVIFLIYFVMLFTYLITGLPEGRWYMRLGHILFVILASILVVNISPWGREVWYEEK